MPDPVSVTARYGYSSWLGRPQRSDTHNVNRDDTTLGHKPRVSRFHEAEVDLQERSLLRSDLEHRDCDGSVARSIFSQHRAITYSVSAACIHRPYLARLPTSKVGVT